MYEVRIWHDNGIYALDDERQLYGDIHMTIDSLYVNLAAVAKLEDIEKLKMKEVTQIAVYYDEE